PRGSRRARCRRPRRARRLAGEPQPLAARENYPGAPFLLALRSSQAEGGFPAAHALARQGTRRASARTREACVRARAPFPLAAFRSPFLPTPSAPPTA